MSRRERQIMDAIYRLGEATVAQITAQLPDPPSRDAVRRMAHILEEKGFLSHHQDGPQNVYQPTLKRQAARSSALDHVLETFFGGSTQSMVAALLDLKRDELDGESLQRIADMVERAARQERE